MMAKPIRALEMHYQIIQFLIICIILIFQEVSKALSTLIRFQKYAFTLSSKTHGSISVRTKTFEKDRIARCDVR